jgi:putative chitinase
MLRLIQEILQIKLQDGNSMSVIVLQRKVGATPDGVFGPNTLRAAARYFNLTPLRAAHFFGQVAHETGNLRLFTENLNYSAQGLLSTFRRHFSGVQDAQAYARQPEKIANRVYASRMGNGPESSGDGWRYRGRGALQLTGFHNYSAFSKAINNPAVLTNPDIVATDLAFESAIWFFDTNRLWTLCDKGITREDITAVTRRVNGGTNGLEDRLAKTIQYHNWLTR